MNLSRERLIEQETVIDACTPDAGRKLGVPLVELDPVPPDKATREAVEDWR